MLARYFMSTKYESLCSIFDENGRNLCPCLYMVRMESGRFRRTLNRRRLFRRNK